MTTKWKYLIKNLLAILLVLVLYRMSFVLYFVHSYFSYDNYNEYVTNIRGLKNLCIEEAYKKINPDITQGYVIASVLASESMKSSPQSVTALLSVNPTLLVKAESGEYLITIKMHYKVYDIIIRKVATVSNDINM